MPVAIAADAEADFGLAVETADDGVEARCLFVRVVGAAPEGGHSAVGVEVAEEGAGGIFGGGDGNGRSIQLIKPPQQTTAVSIASPENATDTLLCDLHSHGNMAAFWSSTDLPFFCRSATFRKACRFSSNTC